MAWVLGLSACATAPTQRLAVGPSGATVAVSLQGPAAGVAGIGPTLVFQSGLGDDQSTWAAVARRVVPQHAVFRYDRPGYGGSERVSAPRDPCSIATELHQLLQAAGVQPPYLLVGHSLGGLYQHAFARLYPNEVAGLLLLDPTHPDHLKTLQADAPALAATLQGLRLTVMSTAAGREFDDQAGCRERLVGPPPQAVPTRVLVSTQRGPLETGSFSVTLDRLRADWRLLTGAARIEPVAGSGHYLQTDQPAAVSAVIESMVVPAAAALISP